MALLLKKCCEITMISEYVNLMTNTQVSQNMLHKQNDIKQPGFLEVARATITTHQMLLSSGWQSPKRILPADEL